MKINNEFKIGLLTIIALSAFAIGFNFLKGRGLWSNSMTLYANYNNVQGLAASNPVVINGLQVGMVSNISNDKDMKKLLVTIELNEKLNIPKNSIAIIIPNPIGNNKLEIKLGDDNNYLKDKDTITTQTSKSIVDDVLQKVDPLLFEVKKAVTTLDTLLKNVNSVFDRTAKNNVSEILTHLNELSASLTASGVSLEKMMEAQNGAVIKSINNIESFTENLAKNNKSINNIIGNLDKTTGKLSSIDLDKTLTSIDSTINSLASTIQRVNSNNGTIGLLMNDQTLYKNLASTSNKLNVLLDDIRTHPKRYVSVSMFGKKDKEVPLKDPLPDTLQSPYIKKQ